MERVLLSHIQNPKELLVKAFPGSLCPNEGETASLSTKFLCTRELKNEEKNDFGMFVL